MDNPWESHDDVSQTIRLLRLLPRPFRVSHFSLTFFPGTELYDRAVREGLVGDLVQDVVRKKNNRLYAEENPYSKLLLSVSPFIRSAVSRRLISAMAHPALLRVLNGRLAAPFWRCAMAVLIRLRGGYNLRRARRNTGESAKGVIRERY